jgi:hypothetical protein
MNHTSNGHFSIFNNITLENALTEILPNFTKFW